MTLPIDSAGDFELGYYAGDRKTGSITIIRRAGGETRIEPVPTGPATGLEPALKPVFIGLTEDRRVILLDPATRALRLEREFPADAFPAHIYEEPDTRHAWFMNDGDKETGNDRLNCGDKGSSVTLVEDIASERARWLGTVCVGRGHHQAAFTRPSAEAPGVPRRAWISNLKDGTLSVVGNDPREPETFLKVVTTLDLSEADKEESGAAGIPNNAFPHELAYSPLTGLVYNLNNGYGNVAVIDPCTDRIIDRFDFKGHSNLFVTPDGRYLIGRGADRKSDPEHVVARLTARDLVTNRVTDVLTLPDVYISKYYFDPEGSRLYLTTSSSGSPEQQANLKQDALIVIDVGALPNLRVIKELRLGSPSGSLAFHPDVHAIRHGAKGRLVFSSHAADGVLVVIDGATNEVLDRIDTGIAGQSHSRVWTLG